MPFSSAELVIINYYNHNTIDCWENKIFLVFTVKSIGVYKIVITIVVCVLLGNSQWVYSSN